MKTKDVIVVDYDPKWSENFLKIKNELSAALGDAAIAIEHVGSTSVPGLAAKPIIDIDVVIRSRDDLSEAVRRLTAIGYIHEGNLGIPDRDAFTYTGKTHLQTHHIYVCPKNSEELHRHITFRNYLKNHPDAVNLYGQIKKEAAALYPTDIDSYIMHKSNCISQLYRLCGLN